MKSKQTVLYSSSYDRGLEDLLDIWPKVLEKVPGAKLHIYYGWNTFDAYHSKDPKKMQWKWQMIRKMNQDGVKEHGRVNHEELSEAMKDAQVWAYPTSFQEISCITAMRTQASKMDVVTSGLAALQETVIKDEPEVIDIHNNPEELDKFADRLVEILLNPTPENELEKTKQQVLDTYAWDVIAKQWDKALA